MFRFRSRFEDIIKILANTPLLKLFEAGPTVFPQTFPDINPFV